MTGELILRIFIAGLLGGVIGFEREYRAKEAGIRTHFLVALGSALFMVISQYAFRGFTFDASRVAAQVVSGIGFIGAGTIIFQKNVVRGLTTAAGLWVAAAIGMACGGGLYWIALAATALVLLCLETMHFVLLRYGERTVTAVFSASSPDALETMLPVLGDPVSFSIDRMLSDGPVRYRLTVVLKIRRKDTPDALRPLLSALPGVQLESLS